jgi:hypothetical protein
MRSRGAFGPAASSALGANGPYLLVEGVAGGSVTFSRVVIGGSTATIVGAGPSVSLIELNGALYGTTASGGVYGNRCGTVFSLKP